MQRTQFRGELKQARGEGEWCSRKLHQLTGSGEVAAAVYSVTVRPTRFAGTLAGLCVH